MRDNVCLQTFRKYDLKITLMHTEHDIGRLFNELSGDIGLKQIKMSSGLTEIVLGKFSTHIF